MSYTIKDRIRGRKLVLTYNAQPLELNRSSSRLERADAVRRHLARAQSSYLLHVHHAGAPMETWWAAQSAGQSFAAGIDAWQETQHGDPDHPPPDDFIIVIPLDTRIYLAEIAHGMVRNERVLPPLAAEEDLKKHTTDGRIVYAFAGGRQGDLVTRYARLEELPFEPHRYVFKRAVAVFARHRLPHPVHAAVTAVLVAIAVAVFWYRAELLQFTLPGPTTPVASAPARLVTPKVLYSAGGDLRALAQAIAVAEQLHGEGLASLEFDGRTARYTGKVQHGFPVLAELVAAGYGGTWHFSEAGWSITLVFETPVVARRPAPVGNETLQALLLHPLQFKLIAGPRQQASPNSDKNIRILPLAVAQFSSARAALTIADVWGGARLLDGLPAQLTLASCRFEQYRLITCTINVETRTL